MPRRWGKSHRCDFQLTKANWPGLGAIRWVRQVTHCQVLHTLTNLVGINTELDAKDEESLVNRLAPALLDCLRANPTFVAYLTS